MQPSATKSQLWWYNRRPMEQHIRPNLQYAVFCSEFVESSGQVSILGVLDGVDVRGTIPRGQPRSP